MTNASQHYSQFYINGAWVDPTTPGTIAVINPATERMIAHIGAGSANDVDKAVAAAKAAFVSFSQTTREERIALLTKIIEVFNRRVREIGQTISDEMGAPLWMANLYQAPSGTEHLKATVEALKTFKFEEQYPTYLMVKEPIGVVGLITPWNWPMNQILAKVAPALAVGCTMVLKPSEIAPLNAIIFAEVLEEAGVPKGVFNLINGTGPEVGTAMSSHPDIDMMSFTGSTRAGISVAKNAADTVKRVHQELGGKSANIILDDANLQEAVTIGVQKVMLNTGQSCNAPTRMLVPAALHDQAVAIAKAVVEALPMGDPKTEGMFMGPVVSEMQFSKIQTLIQQGIDEGCTLVTGGVGKPTGLETGYYVKPTIFANVTNDKIIAREEIFGPVFAIMPYKDEDEAIAIANDTVYGLAGYISSGDIEHARRVAARIRAGNIHINGANVDSNAPFGGFKQSGNGREFAEHGLVEFLEMKAMLGYKAS
jgi:aldehyde dehydrogenase (NAD+)